MTKLHRLEENLRAGFIELRRVPRTAAECARGTGAGGARRGGALSIPRAEGVREEVGGASEVLLDVRAAHLDLVVQRGVVVGQDGMRSRM